MSTKRAQFTVHICTKKLETELMLSQQEIKHRLADFFALLLEIEVDQQNNVAKEYTDAKQTE